MRRVVLLIVVTMMGVLLASGVAFAAVKVGTSGDDVIRGTNGSDVLQGLGGDDIIAGLRGPDVITGGPGNDELYGSNDDRIPTDRDGDVISGEGGKDNIFGSQGVDALRGGGGNDVIFHGPPSDESRDVLVGNRGDDFLVSRDDRNTKDVVKCGGGFDQVIADRGDTISDDCERVF